MLGVLDGSLELVEKPMHYSIPERRRRRAVLLFLVNGDTVLGRAVVFSKATFRCWGRRTHVPYACRTHVLRAPGADPGGRVVGAIDQYVSTTSIIISRGPQLVRKAVLEQTLRGVEDVLWRT